jgi:hypothetical protein
MKKRRNAASWALVPLLVILGMSCSEVPTPSGDDPNSQFVQARTEAEKMAKVLAVVLNENEDIQREVFSKMAYRFDGDRNILFRHLNDNTVLTITRSSVLMKRGGGLHREIDFGKFMEKVPKAQIMMPYLEHWTMKQIREHGGLVVAYYPFGVDDKEIKELIAFTRTGNTIRITRESAPNIPYVLIRSNERTDDEGYLKLAAPQRDPENGTVHDRIRSFHIVDPKYYQLTEMAEWEDINLGDLSKPLTGNLPLALPGCEEEDCGGGGGGGGGGTYYVYKILNVRFNSGWEFFNEGEIELYWKYVQNGNWRKSPVRVTLYTPNQTHYYDPAFTIITNSGDWLNTPIEMWDEDDVYDDKIIDQSNIKRFVSATGLQDLQNVNLQIPMRDQSGTQYFVYESYFGLGDAAMKVYMPGKVNSEFFVVGYRVVN